jgi:hypothetical protein
MSNEDFEAGRKLEKIIQKIYSIREIIAYSINPWVPELNNSNLEIYFKEYLEIANKYGVPQEEISRIERLVKVPFLQTSSTT